ncbi:hypothetical protein ACUNV4_24400 [Granulosicoccus sp. 3-233]|uniref:hypothetical protein n=1 Tax=Granulosicoccus sp. 3-233 TaxID=3417969 RepID=UPI003D33E55B
MAPAEDSDEAMQSSSSQRKVSRQAVLGIDIALVDDAMGIPVPRRAGSYATTGKFYGRNAPVMLFLTLLAYNDPSRVDSAGDSVMDRALEHLHSAVSVEVHPLCRGGHASWFDMYVPVALGIARQAPTFWSTFSDDERQRADLLMRHCLHAANIFLNTNSTLNERSSVLVDMAVTESGSLPNQSASFHAYGIGAYLYFGGSDGMTKVLASYDVDSFRTALRKMAFDDIAELYDNDMLQRLLAGDAISPRARPDPQGVRKPLLFLNTLSLERSNPGEEHPYKGADPIPATPAGIFQRWGHEFAVGAMPRGNVGPASNGLCKGADMGLASGKMPYEGEGKGMPYELNARSSVSGPHTRSSWDYAAWGMQSYTYLFAALSLTGYWDEEDARHQKIIERARRATEIWRYIGEHGWLSSAGPPGQVCTTAHGNAHESFGGNHWAQGLMDGLLSDQWSFFHEPLVP